MPIVPAVADLGEVIQSSVVVTVVMIETALQGQIIPLEMPQVPLADDGRGVADPAQSRRQRLLIEGKSMTCPGPHHTTLQSEPHRVTPGQ